jgi:hypothetical protein
VTRRELFAIASLAPVAIAEANESILGSGWGLDHIEVAVAGPRAARDVYATNLGFTVSQAVAVEPGVEHSAIFLKPAYVEFLWFGGAGEPTDLGCNNCDGRSSRAGHFPAQYRHFTS